MRHPETASRWRPYELALPGPRDAVLRAEFRHAGRTLTAHGFHDGDGLWRVRVMPDEEGPWTFRTVSDVPALDDRAGGFDCLPAAPGEHGQVRVHDRFHFRHADGTRYVPVGTTGYAWTHQPERLEEQTLATLTSTAPPSTSTSGGRPGASRWSSRVRVRGRHRPGVGQPHRAGAGAAPTAAPRDLRFHPRRNSLDIFLRSMSNRPTRLRRL